MAEAGISTSDYPYVNYIVSNESGWCPTKNFKVRYCRICTFIIPGVTKVIGLGQATPGTKMASFGSDWGTNQLLNFRWATSYPTAERQLGKQLIISGRPTTIGKLE